MSTVEGGLAGAGAGEAAALEQGTMSDGEDSSSSASDASSEVGVTGEGDGRGCAHYRRGCMLVAPCCDQTFWCRFCHDAAMDVPNAEVVQHKVDRHAVKEVQCGSCGMRQPVGPSCQNEACKNSFGNYFCRICNFFGVCVCVCVCLLYVLIASFSCQCTGTHTTHTHTNTCRR